jgi:putative membrane protein
MKIKNITPGKIILATITIIYTLIFAFLYLQKENYEFIGYVGVMILITIFIVYLNSKYNFSLGSLIGMSIWGLMHMSGGYFIVGEGVLYGYLIFPFLRFDQFVHAWGFGFATLLSYYIVRPSFNLKDNLKLGVFLVFIGMGLGALNEIIEFIAVLSLPQTGVGGYENTMKDIVFNMFGAIIAVGYINLKNKYFNKNNKRR